MRPEYMGEPPIDRFNDTASMSTPRDPIAEIAYTELIIACEMTGCSSVFGPSLSDPATDPVEAWAGDMADRARQAGWTVGFDGKLKCPSHSDVDSSS